MDNIPQHHSRFLKELMLFCYLDLLYQKFVLFFFRVFASRIRPVARFHSWFSDSLQSNILIQSEQSVDHHHM